MKQYNTNVSREEVAALLSYDPQTGLFTHKVNGHKRRAGAVTGRLDTKGYVRIRLLGYEFKAHRLAWLLTYGMWPTAEIDHINGCPSDNRIMNLRDVSVAENGWNRAKAMRNNKTGVLGVCEMNGSLLRRLVSMVSVCGSARTTLSKKQRWHTVKQKPSCTPSSKEFGGKADAAAGRPDRKDAHLAG